MALPVRDQLKYWGIAAAVFFVLLYLLGDVMLPFVVGAAIAYFLDPIADRLQRRGLTRVASTTLISLVALLAVVLPAAPRDPDARGADGRALRIHRRELVTNVQDWLTTRFPDLLNADSPAPADAAGHRRDAAGARAPSSWRRS